MRLMKWPYVKAGVMLERVTVSQGRRHPHVTQQWGERVALSGD